MSMISLSDLVTVLLGGLLAVLGSREQTHQEDHKWWTEPEIRCPPTRISAVRQPGGSCPPTGSIRCPFSLRSFITSIAMPLEERPVSTVLFGGGTAAAVDKRRLGR